MTRVPLTLACGVYDRTQALADGRVEPDGIDLNYLRIDSGEAFWRQLHWGEFDATEISTSALIMLVGRGSRDYVAIPAFTSRAFRHGCIFVRSDGSVPSPEALKGRKVGVPQYHMTAALWIRGMLSDDYGVRTEDVHWIQGGLDRPDYPERIDLHVPASIELTPVMDRSLSDMLLEGEIDAIIGAEWPGPARAGDSRVAHLFSNYRQAERDYYARTRFFPIMHTIAIQRSIYEQHRWIAQNLYTAFDRAKALGAHNIGFPGTLKYMLPWLAADYRETVALMGQDYWRYGVAASRHEIEAMCRYSFEQGLSPRLVAVEELFAPETVNPFPLGPGR